MRPRCSPDAATRRGAARCAGRAVPRRPTMGSTWSAQARRCGISPPQRGSGADAVRAATDSRDVVADVDVRRPERSSRTSIVTRRARRFRAVRRHVRRIRAGRASQRNDGRRFRHHRRARSSTPGDSGRGAKASSSVTGDQVRRAGGARGLANARARCAPRTP